jgi:hypothetical protein
MNEHFNQLAADLWESKLQAVVSAKDLGDRDRSAVEAIIQKK